MERDHHGHVIRPFTNERKEALLQFRDGGHFSRAGKIGRSNWRHDFYHFLHSKGDTEVTYYNLMCWIRPNYGLIDEGNWTWCMPNLTDEFSHYFDDENDNVANQVVAVPQAAQVAVIDLVPPEVWSLILDELKNPMDIIDAIEAYPSWKKIMEPYKATWLIYFVLEHLLDYLSKEDYLNCRLVCQRWRIAVDHFIENNQIHRPTFEDQRIKKFTGVKLERTDRFDDRLHILYYGKDLHGLSIGPVTVAALLNEDGLANDPNRCPAVGKCGSLHHGIEYNERWTALYLPFFGQVGHHFSFIRLGLSDFPPMENMVRALQLLSRAPNLRGFTLDVPDVAEDEDITSDQIEQQLLEHFGIGCLEDMKPMLPQLESLYLGYTFNFEACSILEDIWLRVLDTTGLESLHIYNPPINHQFAKLASLECVVRVDEEIDSLLLLNSPLRKLSMSYTYTLNTQRFFETILSFGETLRNLQFCFLADPDPETPLNFLPYFYGDTLDAMTRIVTFTCEGDLLPSLNFLIGLQGSILYMNFIMDHDSRPQSIPEGYELPQEILDLLGHFRNALDTTTLNLYGSNMWKYFPKLRVVTFEMTTRRDLPVNADGREVNPENGREQAEGINEEAGDEGRETEDVVHFWEFRRDIYEKLQNSRI